MVAVVVEVVPAQVGEHRHLEPGAVDPVQVEGVRRHLHGHALAAVGAPCAASCSCSSGASGVVRAPVRVPMTPAPPAGGVEDGAEEVGDGGLAVGAGDADHRRATPTGRPHTAAASGPMAAAHRGRPAARARRGRAALDSRAAAPGPTAPAAKSWPSTVAPGTQQNRVPGPTRAGVVGDRSATTVAGSPTTSRSRERRLGRCGRHQFAELHRLSLAEWRSVTGDILAVDLSGRLRELGHRVLGPDRAGRAAGSA